MSQDKCDIDRHGYAVFHYFTGGKMDDITCSVCGKVIYFDEKTGWWQTKEEKFQ